MIPPFFAQVATPRLLRRLAFGQGAFEDDPAWAQTGARSRAEYARWANHLCGMACLQMALGALGRPVPTIHALRRAVQRLGGYELQQDGSIRGLVYAGAVAWLRRQGIPAEIILDQPAAAIPGWLAAGRLYVASVHPAIRTPAADPPQTGGHLVLVFGTDRQGRLRFHNPSGHLAATRRDARLDVPSFARFHAERGILLG
ncbi:hypothetical protein ACI6QG_11805 [Roseococcus sp. DSY-14]|uniref:hypothetical protein n=1 Tax=Roseococcus sp. DSY-14 TaxID=3369650 RepID=UPI00387B97DB